MAKKKQAKKKTKAIVQPQVQVNVFDLMGVGMKLLPKLMPIAQEIANEILQDPKMKKFEKELETKKGKKKVVLKKKKIKLDYRHDLCKCGKVKTKEARVCRDCFNKGK